VFFPESVEESDIHDNLKNLYLKITSSILAQTTDSSMCSELVFDVEILRPVGSESENKVAAKVRPPFRRPIVENGVESFTKKSKRVSLHFRYLLFAVSCSV
jgi:hypothetical protein